MARMQHSLDRQPGSLPDITSTVSDTTFVMSPPGVPAGKQLAVRCEADGRVWIAIRNRPPST